METFNYFNYFTEIEEYFWRKRGAHLLVSPLDWAIVETWQKAGVPLEAVLKGIDRAFESWSRSRRAAGGRQLKSLAYCVDAVLDAAEEASEAAAGSGPEIKRTQPAAEPFSREEMKKYFERNAARLRAAAEKRRATHAALAARLDETAKRLDDARRCSNRLRRSISKISSAASPCSKKSSARRFPPTRMKKRCSAIRREMDRSLAPYRRKMSADQLAQLERQYIQKRLYELFEVPRLSLFYLT